MKKNRVEMNLADSLERIKNFDEVALGYTLDQAVEEANRCLECKKPKCVSSCPVGIQIPDFIKEIKEGNLLEAYKVISKDNKLPSICGRVCPQESQCEGSCIVGIKGVSVAIGNLERFVGDYAIENKVDLSVEINKKGKSVAVVGSGPAGLTCASVLAERGYDVTVYEALHEFGGVLTYGIPEFRLPKSLVKTEIDNIKKLGVKFEKNVIVGKSVMLKELMEEMNFSAVFIGSGAGLPRILGVKGENLNGVYYANEFLTRVNLMKSYDFPNVPTPVKLGQNVAVIGGGNVAMDCARTAKRLGSKNVYIVYRRAFEQLPARYEEILHAKEEGIEFKLLYSPTEFIGEDFTVKGMNCQVMELGQPDDSGRRRPVPIEGKFEYIDVDNIIIAIGQLPNPILRNSDKNLTVNKWGCIEVNEVTQRTSIKGVYAGGDAVSGAATVILAMGAGKESAIEIDKYLSSI